MTMDDLARTFFDFLYDQRVPIAIATAVAAVLLALVAWQRGWFAAARRHPARTGALVAVAAIVGLPLTWYLASPIWIRTSLVEAAPTAVATQAPTAIATQAPSPSAVVASDPPATLEPTPAPTATAFAARTVAMGEF